jgi:hypothetical protein
MTFSVRRIHHARLHYVVSCRNSANERTVIYSESQWETDFTRKPVDLFFFSKHCIVMVFGTTRAHERFPTWAPATWVYLANVRHLPVLTMAREQHICTIIRHFWVSRSNVSTDIRILDENTSRGIPMFGQAMQVFFAGFFPGMGGGRLIQVFVIGFFFQIKNMLLHHGLCNAGVFVEYASRGNTLFVYAPAERTIVGVFAKYASRGSPVIICSVQRSSTVSKGPSITRVRADRAYGFPVQQKIFVTEPQAHLLRSLTDRNRFAYKRTVCAAVHTCCALRIHRRAIFTN